MEMKYTLSLCSNSEEQQMQQIQDTAKKSCMKSIDERAQHKHEYNSRVNERQMQTTEGKVDTCKALDASLVNTASSGTESVEQDTSIMLGLKVFLMLFELLLLMFLLMLLSWS
ncbi:hypothetical protein Tco_1106950 [Tanacetum coccineum]